MSSIQYFAYPDCSQLANFIGWAKPIHNAMASFGWTQTADTGQINWSALTSAPSAGTTYYEIWQAGDTLQSTSPMFVMITYGTLSYNAPYMAIQVGTGSNGAGALTNAGPTTAFANSSRYGTLVSTSTTSTWSISGASNRMSFYMLQGFVNPWIFSVERSHNADGTDNGNYINYVVGSYTVGAAVSSTASNYAQQSIFPENQGGPQNFEQGLMTFQTSNSTSGFYNGILVACPVFPLAGFLDYPMTGVVNILTSDFPVGSVFQSTIYGSAHSYLVASGSGYPLQTNQNKGLQSLAIRFE